MYVSGKTYPSTVGVGTSNWWSSAVSETAAASDSGAIASFDAKSGMIWASANPSGIVTERTSPFPARIASSVAPYPLLRCSMYVPALMARSSRRMNAYARKNRAEPITPARASDSAAVPNEAPTGTVTRTGRPGLRPQAAISTPTIVQRATNPTGRANARRLLILTRESMLQQYGCGECIDISSPMTRRTTHLADGPPRGSGRVALID